MNAAKTVLLMGLMTALLMGVGYLIGGQRGMALFLGISILMNFGTYWFSDKMVLAMYHAQPITRDQSPKLFSMVEELTQRAGLPMPKVYVIPTDTPNAFATGRSPKHAAVAATEGILRLLNERELRGVIGHELAHIRNYDMLTGTIAAAMGGAISMAAHALMWFGGGRDSRDNPLGAITTILVILLAPLAAMLIQMAVSRSREYAADAAGAEFAKDPMALASALAKLHEGVHVRPMQMGNEATAHLFIINPFFGKAALGNLFSTHPPVEQRIARLQSMATGRNW